MELNTIERVYLIGIGGIGMSALARYFHKRNCIVHGYDRTETPLTQNMVDEGIEITYEDHIDNIPDGFKASSDSTLVIYTPAIPKDSAIANYFNEHDFKVKKRSQVLGIISSGMFTIAVAGTHGKTTTSSMVAHILTDSGFSCSAFLGGITSNYDTNVLFSNNNVVVIEADEYDRSFLTLYPDISIITSMDADHLDIYGDKNSLTDSFRLFTSQLKRDGKLIHKKGLNLNFGITYSVNDESADVLAENISIRNGSFYFDLKSDDLVIKDICLGIPGLYNIENALAAAKVALLLDITPEKIKTALENFKGVKRRFEYILKNDQHIFIDDYAHHPEELRACISAVKALYPDRKLTTIFQPHLYTRTRDFAEGFAEVLGLVDQLILLDIYPARELPIAGVSSEIILEKINIADKQNISKANAIEYVRKNKPELLLTVGAGDIDALIDSFKNALENA